MANEWDRTATMMRVANSEGVVAVLPIRHKQSTMWLEERNRNRIRLPMMLFKGPNALKNWNQWQIMGSIMPKDKTKVRSIIA